MWLEVLTLFSTTPLSDVGLCKAHGVGRLRQGLGLRPGGMKFGLVMAQRKLFLPQKQELSFKGYRVYSFHIRSDMKFS